MAQSIQEVSGKQQADRLMDAVYESLALRGDISMLKGPDKITYVRTFCERLGLDPASIPVQTLKLNNKEVLYFTKGATDQLARLHHVSRSVVSRERVEDVYIVTVRATLPDGRSEDSIGAVSIGGLKGDALSNALMKAETKGKRRVTLSILGVGVLDESELETIPAKAIAAVADEDRITPDQRRRLAMLIKDLNGYGVDNNDLKAKMMDIAGVDKTADLSSIHAEDVAGVYEAWKSQLIEAAEANQDAAERNAGESEKVKAPSVPF